MKKEILIAIIIGFVLGLVITFGIWTANKSLKESVSTQKQEATEIESTTTPAPQESEEKLPLTIISPTDNSLISKEKIEIVGKTSPNVLLTILYREGEKIIEADEKGDFKGEITLVGGGNEITISAFDNEGNEVSKTLNLVYSTAEI